MPDVGQAAGGDDVTPLFWTVMEGSRRRGSDENSLPHPYRPPQGGKCNCHMQMQKGKIAGFRLLRLFSPIFMKLNNFGAKGHGLMAPMERSDYVDENRMGYGNNRTISPRLLVFKLLEKS